jgi:hypothetical protein
MTLSDWKNHPATIRGVFHVIILILLTTKCFDWNKENAAYTRAMRSTFTQIFGINSIADYEIPTTQTDTDDDAPTTMARDGYGGMFVYHPTLQSNHMELFTFNETVHMLEEVLSNYLEIGNRSTATLQYATTESPLVCIESPMPMKIETYYWDDNAHKVKTYGDEVLTFEDLYMFIYGIEGSERGRRRLDVQQPTSRRRYRQKQYTDKQQGNSARRSKRKELSERTKDEYQRNDRRRKLQRTTILKESVSPEEQHWMNYFQDLVNFQIHLSLCNIDKNQGTVMNKYNIWKVIIDYEFVNQIYLNIKVDSFLISSSQNPLTTDSSGVEDPVVWTEIFVILVGIMYGVLVIKVKNLFFPSVALSDINLYRLNRICSALIPSIFKYVELMQWQDQNIWNDRKRRKRNHRFGWISIRMTHKKDKQIGNRMRMKTMILL